MKYAVIFLTSLFAVSSLAAQPISVPIHFFEALAPKDTTSSERFQKEYDSAIQTAKLLTSKRLKSCGYKIADKTIFYNATDALEGHEGGQASEKANAWLIVGPRRSNHYVLLAKGAPKTPSISTMASSQEVEALGALHLSIAPSNGKMAKFAAREARDLVSSGKPKTYAAVVSEDCVACIDFGIQFDKEAKVNGLKRLAEIKINGETPELAAAVKTLGELNPSILLVPNYSKVSAQVIASVHKRLPDVLFIGADGWGDSRFGFVQDATSMEGTSGITVRGFPPTESALTNFALGKELLNSTDPTLTKPGSAAALGILKILEGAVELLCKQRPKNAVQFKAAFLKSGRKAMQSPWGVSIYRLKDGDITFQRIAEGSTK